MIVSETLVARWRKSVGMQRFRNGLLKITIRKSNFWDVR